MGEISASPNVDAKYSRSPSNCAVALISTSRRRVCVRMIRRQSKQSRSASMERLWHSSMTRMDTSASELISPPSALISPPILAVR